MSAAPETIVHRTDRLLTAAGQLLDEQTALLSEGDFEGVATSATRLAPVVVEICALIIDPRVPAPARERLARVQARLEADRGVLAMRMQATRDELAALRASEARVSRMAPAYRQADEMASVTPAFSMQA